MKQNGLARVQADGFGATPGLSWNGKTLQGQPLRITPMVAAVLEVEIGADRRIRIASG